MADLGLLFISITWALSAMGIKVLTKNAEGYLIAILTILLSILLFCALFLIKNQKPQFIFDKWIIIGGIGFAVYQMFLNIGLSVGYAQTSIMTYAFETIFIAVYSHLFLNEKIDRMDVLSIFICIVGICLINFNGVTINDFFKSVTLYLFMLAGFGMGTNTVSNKILVEKYVTLSYLFSTYIISFIFLLPMLIVKHSSIAFSFLLDPKNCALLLFLGVTSGANIYVFSELLRKVEFIRAVVLTKSLLIFNILFSRLFFNEMITDKVVIGMVFIAVGMGLLSVNEKIKNVGG